MNQIDPFLPGGSDLPPEWAELPAELIDALTPKNGLYTPAQMRQLTALAKGRWFLLRNDGPSGERWPCKRCGRLHSFFTLGCVARPFNGLQSIVGLIRQRDGPDVAWSSVALGSIVPIPADKARDLLAEIQGRGFLV